MGIFKNKFSFFLLLSTYTLLLTAGLLYYRFPAESFKRYCETSLAQFLPDSKCSIKSISYTFPMGITLQDIEFLSAKSTTTRLFFIQRADIVGTPLDLTSRFHVMMNAGEGRISFTVNREPEKKLLQLDDIRVSHFNLEKALFLHHTMNRTITGFLELEGTFQRTWKSGKALSTGKGKASISDGSFGLLYPILSLKEIDLQSMESSFDLQDKELKISNGTFNGKELTGSFSGALAVQPRFPLSVFSIRGEMEPLPPLLKKSKYAQNMIIQLKKQRKRGSLPFLLKGTVEKPRFHFDS